MTNMTPQEAAANSAVELAQPRLVEFRIKKTTSYTVTRYIDRSDPTDRGTNKSSKEVEFKCFGAYSSENLAYEVAYALATAARDDFGFNVGDERIIFPDAPASFNSIPRVVNSSVPEPEWT